MTIRLEDAAKCPKCGVPGEVVNRTQIVDEGELWDVVAYKCDTELCPWCDSHWFVQSDKNGIVYEREIGERGMDKTFPKISADQLALGRRILENAIREEHISDGK
jgi:hypothetical protein